MPSESWLKKPPGLLDWLGVTKEVASKIMADNEYRDGDYVTSVGSTYVTSVSSTMRTGPMAGAVITTTNAAGILGGPIYSLLRTAPKLEVIISARMDGKEFKRMELSIEEWNEFAEWRKNKGVGEPEQKPSLAFEIPERAIDIGQNGSGK